ncbi:MAG TPA: DUF4124 domain-containing protein [Gammaproteobacteria bacterium]|nr:DUF4124 domain-containing protein [Gammaproteobacteria bacterium]
MNIYARLLPLLLLTVFLPLTVSAAVYSWVDDKGQIHYSDTPPPDVQAKATQFESESTDNEQSNTQQATREKRIEQIEKIQAVEAEIAAKKAEKAARNAKLCAAAREWQTKIQRNRRLYDTNEKGEREYYTSAEIDAARAEAAADVEKYCE